MKERPIPYAPEMMAARRAGMKTETRRLVVPMPPFMFREGDVAPITNGSGRWSISRCPEKVAWHPDPHPGILCPYGVSGDRLWTKERHAYLDVVKSSMSNFGGDGEEVWNLKVEYSDGTEYNRSVTGPKPKQTRERGEEKWRPAMFMHRWASRGLDEVVATELARLHDITEEGALAEGVRRVKAGAGMLFMDYMASTARDAKFILVSARESYRTLWDKLNAERAPWTSNPWVWVVKFRRIT